MCTRRCHCSGSLSATATTWTRSARRQTALLRAASCGQCLRWRLLVGSVFGGGFLRAVSSAQRCQQCRLQLLSRASAFGRSGRSLGSRLGDLLAKFVSRVRRQRNCRCRRLVLLADFLGRLLRRVAVAVAVRSSWDVGMVVAELQVD